MCQSLTRRLRSLPRLQWIEYGSKVATSPQRRQQSSGYESSLGLPSVTAREFWPRTGRVMTFGYDANSMWQNWSKTSTTRFERQSLFAADMYVAAQDTGDSEHCIDSLPQTLDGGMDGRRYPARGNDADKHCEVIPHCWGRREINNKGNTVVTTTVCKITSNTRVDGMIQGSYKASLEQVTKPDSPTSAAFLGHRNFAGFPLYSRLREVLRSLVYPLVAFSYPTTISAAALSWRCNLCSSGISSLPSSLYMLRKANKNNRTSSFRYGYGFQRRLGLAMVSRTTCSTVLSHLQRRLIACLSTGYRCIPQVLICGVKWLVGSHLCVGGNGNDAEVLALGGRGDAPRQLEFPGVHENHPGAPAP